MSGDEMVRHGGLMRCCLATLAEKRSGVADLPKDGDVIRCQYCNNPMIWRDGAWEWQRDG